MAKPFAERRRILKENVVEIKDKISYSECTRIRTPDELQALMARVMKESLEGLVLKDGKGRRLWAYRTSSGRWFAHGWFA